jgi:uracil-DNA glycosylase
LTKIKGQEILAENMEYKQFEKSWREKLSGEMEKPYFKSLLLFLEQERQTKNIFPSEAKVFAPFKQTPFESIKAVIVGQDPYHKMGQANGFAFCVEQGQKLPPSLKNIYKEMQSDLKQRPQDLKALCGEGLFLLNTVLTVVENSPLSHQNIGWERFTDCVLTLLWKSEKKIVFLLWGKEAKKKKARLFTGESDHLVLTAGHPSPLSARYFLGCKHFTKANTFLKEHREEIDWTKE